MSNSKITSIALIAHSWVHPWLLNLFISSWSRFKCWARYRVQAMKIRFGRQVVVCHCNICCVCLLHPSFSVVILTTEWWCLCFEGTHELPIFINSFQLVLKCCGDRVAIKSLCNSQGMWNLCPKYITSRSTSYFPKMVSAHCIVPCNFVSSGCVSSHQRSGTAECLAPRHSFFFQLGAIYFML